MNDEYMARLPFLAFVKVRISARTRENLLYYFIREFLIRLTGFSWTFLAVRVPG
jgi:hypothetical protein